MKRNFWIILLLFISGSCLKEPDSIGYKVNLTVRFGPNFPQESKEGLRVTLSNQTKGYVLEAYTDANGRVDFSSIEPGFYRSAVTYSYPEKDFLHYYNGLKSIEVFSDITDSIHLNYSKSGDFIIKEYYYSGSTTPMGKPYSADQYIEIINNTNEMHYADGISVVEHESYGSGVNFWAGLKDTIVARMIWTIPGNGNQVPVLPGESIVLARTAINHRDDPNGNPLSPVNLGDADFEFYVSKQPESDLDVPGVPNLIEDLFVFRGADVAFHVKGGSALALVKIPGKNETERKEYLRKHMAPKESGAGTKTTYFAKIANTCVLDAVEVVFDEAHAIYKRFPPELDAGYTYVLAGSGSGKCIRRKTREVVAGRIFYQDTNNSSEDFLKDVDPRPKNR